MTLDPELKEAVLNLPTQKKDRLLLRLLKKDLNLINQLHFELVSQRSQEELRCELELRIKQKVSDSANRFHSVGVLIIHLRSISGLISEHVRTTKDRFGEVSLNILMLNEALSLNAVYINNTSIQQSHKLCIYIVARSFKILILINKMHSDVLLDFQEDLERLGALFGGIPNLMHTAIQNGFDANWLSSGNIPDNVGDIYKEVRSQGLLR